MHILTTRSCAVPAAALGLVLLVGGSAALAASQEDQDPKEPATRVRVFTNADLDQLPPTDNDSLPSGEVEVPEGAIVLRNTDPSPTSGKETDDAVPAPAPAKTAPPADPAEAERALEWLSEWRTRAELDRKIASAERRVRDAARELERIGIDGTDGTVNEALYNRGVADPGTPRVTARREAQQELANAREELSFLLDQSGNTK